MRRALPDHIADQKLTANQERVRFIARDVREYAEKAPAGLKLVVVNQEAANTDHHVVVWVILDTLKSMITVHDNL